MPRSSGSRPKKRKGFFHKNNTFFSKIRIREESEQSPTVDLDSEPPTPSQSSGVDIEKSTPSSSRSKQKLEGLYGVTNSSDESDSDLDLESYDCEDQSEAGCRIIDLDLLKSQVRLDLVCRQCHSTSEVVDGYTQNANESINQKIWKICPKNQYHGAKTVRTAVAVATVTFNDGMKSFIKIFDHLQIRPGFFTYIFVTNEDKKG